MKTNNTLTVNTTKAPLGMKQRLLSYGLVLACVFLAFVLAAFIAVSAVVLEPHTYKRAAKDEAYLAGVEDAVVDIMKKAAGENGLSKTMLMKHAQREDIHELAKGNAADAALVLKGSQVIYGDSFNQATLQTDIYKFYEQRLPKASPAEENVSQEPATQQPTKGSDASAQQPADNSNEAVPPIQAQDTAPLLGKTEEDLEREALRETSDELAAEISAEIDAAVRVIDMEQVVYEYSHESLVDWLRFMGRGGVLLPLVLLAIMLLLLYRRTWKRGFSPWLAGVSICSGGVLLVCAAVIPTMGRLNLSVEPVQLAILYESIMKGILAELIVMALLWFVVSYIAIRAAVGKPVSTKWLHTLLARLRPADAPEESASENNESAENATVPGESSIGDVSSDVSACPSGSKNHPDLLQTIKKAAADSTNSLLGRKRR